MAEQFKDSVTISGAAGTPGTVITGTKLHVGRAAAQRGRRPGLPNAAAPTAPAVGSVAAGPGTVLTGTPPALPDVLLDVGDKGSSGGVIVRDKSDQAVISLNGESGTVTLGTGKGASGALVLRGDQNGPVVVFDGATGTLQFFNRRLEQVLIIDALEGDIRFVGADCAEDFDVAIAGEPGSVMCLDDAGKVRPCENPYDTRVAGVVSGAGGFRPGLRLDRRESGSIRQPLALMGKVACLVDAVDAPVHPGDLLTTSRVAGHAMVASDGRRVAGSILGKSLGSLEGDRGLVPILVAMQ